MLAVLAPAELRALRRIDALEPDALAVDFQRIAIDHAGLPREIIGKATPVAVNSNSMTSNQRWRRMR